MQHILGEKIISRGSRFVQRVEQNGKTKFFVFSRCYSGQSRKVKTIGVFDTIQAAKFALGFSLKDIL